MPLAFICKLSRVSLTWTFGTDGSRIFPETAKKSLEDINAEFGEVVAVRYSDVTTEDKKKYRTAIEVEDVSSEIAATVEAKV